MKNFIPRGNKTRKDRIKTNVAKVYPFSACAVSLSNDVNINLIYRSLANFAGTEFFIIGSKEWHQGATNGLEDIIKITYFKTINEFLLYIKTTQYSLVAIEQTESSESLMTFKHPKKPCFMFGHESYGLTSDVMVWSDHIVDIPIEGHHPSFNVGVCAGIVMYDFVNKYDR